MKSDNPGPPGRIVSSCLSGIRGDGKWTMDDLAEDEGFSITPLMRPVLARVSGVLGLRIS